MSALTLITALLVQGGYVATVSPRVDVSRAIPPPRARDGEEIVLEDLHARSFALTSASTSARLAFVDVTFERARLDAESQGDLGIETEVPVPILYQTQGTQSQGTEACGTRIDITAEERAPAPVRLRLSQPEIAGADPNSTRSLTLRPEGGPLKVVLDLETPESGDDQGPGCRKIIRVGNKKGHGALSLTAIAEENTAVTFTFRPRPLGAPLWPEDGWFSPFALGLPAPRRGEAPSALAVGAVGIQPRRAAAYRLLARSAPQRAAAAGAGLLQIGDLELGPDALRVRLSGTGRVTRNGRPVGGSFLARLRAAPLFFAASAAVDAVLCFLLLLQTRRAKRRPVTDDASAARVPTSEERERNAALVERKREAREYDVFLCHNSRDKPAVRALAERLKEQGILPWLDEQDLRPGLPYTSAIEEQITQTKAAAVLVGKSGLGSWQDFEQSAFLREFINRKCPVIPVILPDCEETPKLPFFLSGMTWVDFRQTEPDPLDRLIFGITGERDPD